MKAVIPVAGIGARLRPHTHTQPKSLVPVAGKPILGHLIESLVAGGITEFVFIIGYLGSKIESYVKNTYEPKGVKSTFVLQEPRKGTAHAVWSAREQLEGEREFLILLGDSIINMDIQAFMRNKHTVVGIKKVDKPEFFGVVELDEHSFVKKLIEKPRIPKSNSALVGIYKIATPTLFMDCIDEMITRQMMSHGEYQLTDALSLLLEKGEKIVTQTVENWYDCGKKESLLKANAILLSDPTFQQINDKAYPGTIIIPPVSIGKDCNIKHSIIGPNVAIGDNSIVSYSIIKDTIIGSYSEIKSAVMDYSIIGNDSSLHGLTESLNIGDNTEINFTGWSGDTKPE